MIRSYLLSQLDWIDHGFGTRHSNLNQDGMASLKQIHSNIALLADREQGCIGEGDALIATGPDIAVSIRTADCIPILLTDPKTRSVAAVHAGWRGTAAGIIGEALRRMTVDPSRVYAAIGPGIGVCCYEVGLEVAQQFGKSQAGRLDLAEENRRQLQILGVLPERIDVLKLCTFCHPDKFHSFRRDRDQAGRMVSYIKAKKL